MTTPTPCAIVVGAGVRQGLGGALCARFAQEGLPVYAAGRNREKLTGLAEAVREEGGDITSVVTDS